MCKKNLIVHKKGKELMVTTQGQNAIIEQLFIKCLFPFFQEILYFNETILNKEKKLDIVFSISHAGIMH